MCHTIEVSPLAAAAHAPAVVGGCAREKSQPTTYIQRPGEHFKSCNQRVREREREAFSLQVESLSEGTAPGEEEEGIMNRRGNYDCEPRTLLRTCAAAGDDDESVAIGIRAVARLQ